MDTFGFPSDVDNISNLLFKFKNSLKRESFPNKLQRLLSKLKNILKVEAHTADIKLDPSALSKLLNTFKIYDSRGREQRSVSSPGLNIWKSLALGRDEVKNCRILAWLLDREADHYQESRFLKCLLQASDLTDYMMYADEKYYVSREDWLDDSNRVDIIIRSESFNLVIEAKIDAYQNDNQCEKYKNIITNRNPAKKFIGIFLTINGTPSNDNDYTSITWKHVYNALDIFSSHNHESSCRNEFIRLLSKQYSQHLKSMML